MARIQLGVRYVLIGLGLITLGLAVVLAREGLWWAAISAAFFGGGIPWVAWVSLQDEKRAHRHALRPEAAALEPSPEPIEDAVAPAEPMPPPAPVVPASPPPVVYPPVMPRPAHVRSRGKRRKHR